MPEQRTLRLKLAYDGTDYVGWQIQPNGPSVQAAVEQAIAQLTGQPANVMAAGRTDSGVHALGQVASFRTASRIPCVQFRRGLQNFLPEDILVREVDEVPADFHATHSALFKRYRYIIRNDRVRDPFLRRYVWQYHAPLDTDLMAAAAQQLVGTHDFRSFESHWPNKATSVRTVLEATITRQPGWHVWQTLLPAVSSAETSAAGAQPESCSPADGLAASGFSLAELTRGAATGEGEPLPPFLCFDIVADGFLYNMVRAITGTLIKAGLGRWSPAEVRRVLENQSRDHAGETAPARGLYLVHVEYDTPHPQQPPKNQRPG